MCHAEKDSDEWTPWSPCSVTCGHGEKKRTKSCGYSCTLTEASKCDVDPCPGETTCCTCEDEDEKKKVLHFFKGFSFAGDVNAVVEPFPFEMENGTEPFGTGTVWNQSLFLSFYTQNYALKSHSNHFINYLYIIQNGVL